MRFRDGESTGEEEGREEEEGEEEEEDGKEDGVVNGVGARDVVEEVLLGKEDISTDLRGGKETGGGVLRPPYEGCVEEGV